MFNVKHVQSQTETQPLFSQNDSTADICAVYVYDVFRGVMSVLLTPACLHGSRVSESMVMPQDEFLHPRKDLSVSGRTPTGQSFKDCQRPSMCTYKMFGSSLSVCQA